MRVLVAEDEPMIARILEHKLVREGHAVTRATATAELRSGFEDADLALVDVSLDGDGLEAAAALPPPRCGWIAMVEAAPPGDAERAHALGAAAVVVKPFKPTEVAALVERLTRPVAGGPR